MERVSQTIRFNKGPPSLGLHLLRSIIIHHGSANAGVPCTPVQEIEGSEGKYLIGGGVVVSEAACYLWDVGSESYRPSKYNKKPENHRKRLTDPTPTCWAKLVLWPVSPPLNSPDPGPSQPRIVSMGSGCWSEPSWLSCSVPPCRPARPQTALVSEKCCIRTPSPVTFITKLGKRISYVYFRIYIGYGTLSWHQLARALHIPKSNIALVEGIFKV